MLSLTVFIRGSLGFVVILEQILQDTRDVLTMAPCVGVTVLLLSVMSLRICCHYKGFSYLM